MTFLEWGLKALKKGGKLFYHAFCNVDGIDEEVKKLVEEGKELGRKLKIVEVVRAGDIAPYKFRYRIEFKIMN
jgi:tRNA G37 N-methylase Trm5